MAFTTDLVEAVAVALDAASVGLWSTDAAYPSIPSRPPIFVGVTPGTPDQVITLSPYGVEDTTEEHSTVGVQVRVRGTRDPRAAYDLDDAVFRVLHRPLGVVFGAVQVAVSYRASGPAVLGRDANDRTELSSNYYLLLARPSVEPWS